MVKFMKNKNAERVLGQPDQHTYYNAVQLSLPVNTLISLEKAATALNFKLVQLLQPFFITS